MKDGLVTHYLNIAQTLLDYGFPVVMHGTEYFQADKLYIRAEVVRPGNIREYTPLEAPLSRMDMLELASSLSESEILQITTTKALNELKGRRPIQEMILCAKKIQALYALKPMVISKYLNDEDEFVSLNTPVEVHLRKDVGQLPLMIMSEEFFEKGRAITKFETSWGFSVADNQPNQSIPKDARIAGSVHFSSRPTVIPDHRVTKEINNELAKIS